MVRNQLSSSISAPSPIVPSGIAYRIHDMRFIQNLRTNKLPRFPSVTPSAIASFSTIAVCVQLWGTSSFMVEQPHLKAWIGNDELHSVTATTDFFSLEMVMKSIYIDYHPDLHI